MTRGMLGCRGSCVAGVALSLLTVLGACSRDAGPSVALSVASTLSVRLGERKPLPVTVTGHTSLPGDVMLKLSGLPEGVTATPAVVSPQDSGVTEIIVSVSPEAATGGPRAFVVTARSAGLPDVTAAVALFVTGIPGTVDLSFGEGGTLSSPAGIDGLALGSIDMTMLADDGVAAVGVGEAVETSTCYVMRFRPDGRPDDTFGIGGLATLGTEISAEGLDCYSVREDNQKRLLVAGSQAPIVSEGYGDRDFVVVRLNRDGTLDLSFGNQGKVRIDWPGMGGGVARLTEPDEEGRILVAGTVHRLDDRAHQYPGLVRLLSSGEIDTSFGDGGRLVMEDIPGHSVFRTRVIRSGDGGYLVSSKGRDAGMDIGLVTRLTQSGTLDSSFGSPSSPGSRSFTQGAQAVLIGPDGRVFVLLSRDDSQGCSVVALTPSGGIATDFGTSGTATIPKKDSQAFVAGPDNRLYVSIDNLGDEPPSSRVLAARMSFDGRLDGGFAPLVPLPLVENDARNYWVGVQSTGRILVGGVTNPFDADRTRFFVTAIWP